MSIIADALCALKEAMAPATPLAPTHPHPQKDGTTFVVVKDGYKVLQHPGPEHPRRLHRFHDLESFANWLLRHADPAKVEIGVDRTEYQVRAILENGVRPDSVSLALDYEPAFDALISQTSEDTKLSQREFHHLIRAHRSAIAHSDVLLTELASLRRVDGGEVEVRIDERGFTRYAGSKATAEVSGSLPPEFKLYSTVFRGVGIDAFGVEILVSMESSPEGFSFRLACPSEANVIEDAVAEVGGKLQGLLGDAFQVSLAALSTEYVLRQVEE